MADEWERHGWGLVPVLDKAKSVDRGAGLVSLKRDPWFCHYLPVSDHNDDLKFFVDGEGYGASLLDDLRNAQSEICMTGLHFVGHFHLKRSAGTKPDNPSDPEALQKVLAEKSRTAKIYILVNQFWDNEPDLIARFWKGKRELEESPWGGRHPLLGYIIIAGGLENYLNETRSFFAYLQDPQNGGNPGNVHCFTDVHQGYVMHTNHQKTIIIDRKIAYWGGIDLTDIDADRWDTNAHVPGDARRNYDKPERNWHDVHLRVSNPAGSTDGSSGHAVDYVYANFLARYNHGYLFRHTRDSSGNFQQEKITDPAAHSLLPDKVKTYVPWAARIYPAERTYHPGRKPLEPLKDPVIQIVRSMPPGNSGNFKDRQRPNWNLSENLKFERSARDAYLIGIRAARKFIYLENQWIADKLIWAELRAKAKERAKDGNFRIVVVIPKKFLRAAGFGAGQALDLKPLVRKVANEFKKAGCPKHFGIYSILQPSGCVDLKGQPVPHHQVPECVWDYMYVHSKVMIVDDCWLLVGSANGGGISLTGVGFENEPDAELSSIIVDETGNSKIKDLRKRLWAEHLQVQPGDVDDYRSAADKFRQRAEGQDYANTKSARVHYNLLYYPLSERAKRSGNTGKWEHLKWEILRQQVTHRQKFPDQVHPTYYDLSMPLTAVHMLLTRDPGRYARLVEDVFRKGDFADLKQVMPYPSMDDEIAPEKPILEVDWMLGQALNMGNGTPLERLSYLMDYLIPCHEVTTHTCSVWGEVTEAKRASEALKGQGSPPTAFVAAYIKTAMLVGRDEDLIKQDKGKPGFDLSRPYYWYNKAPGHPFLKLAQDRAYPFYPGVLSPHDVAHLIPSRMFIRLTRPIEWIGGESKPTGLKMTFWAWGAQATATMDIKHFEKNVSAFVIGTFS
ncbi:MAG TPA: hypothetical protein VMS93_12910 [Candidatus Saccharimonadales bacterium]|nr:hypothetical protein [Candidatus Saccharimonadales bacterium]